jgi:hypothetical protein
MDSVGRESAFPEGAGAGAVVDDVTVEQAESERLASSRSTDPNAKLTRITLDIALGLQPHHLESYQAETGTKTHRGHPPAKARLCGLCIGRSDGGGQRAEWTSVGGSDGGEWSRSAKAWSQSACEGITGERHIGSTD